jgi:hypothetical protein
MPQIATSIRQLGQASLYPLLKSHMHDVATDSQRENRTPGRRPPRPSLKATLP